MAEKPEKVRFTSVPKSAMNQWVSDALVHSGLTLREVAERLKEAGLGNFDKAAVHKMTGSRVVRLDVAMEISEVTGYPLPRTLEHEQILEVLTQLNDENQRAVRALVRGLLASQGDGEPD